MRAQPVLLLVLACIQAACAFVPSLKHRPLYRADATASVQSCAMQADAPDLAFSRREMLSRAAAVGLLVAPVVHAVPVSAMAVPAGAMQGGKPGNLPSVLQGLVLQCQDLESEVDFWTKGLGMKVLRRTRGSVVVGYGPESFALEKGGHVSLELVQASSAAASPAKVKLELSLPARTNLILDAEEAGGKVQPAWFGTTGYTSFESPNGFLARIETAKAKQVPYPVKAVAIQSANVAATAKELTTLLQLSPDDGFLLPFSDPTSKTLRFISGKAASQNVALVVEPLDVLPAQGRPSKSKMALLKQKQKGESAGDGVDDEGVPSAPESNFVLSFVSSTTKPTGTATSTGVRVRVVAEKAFQDALPAPPPVAASASKAATKVARDLEEDEEEEE